MQIRQYFHERCSGEPSSNKFWSTIKPFLSNKGYSDHGNIILFEGAALVSDPEKVCNIFNDHYVNIAQNIGPMPSSGQPLNDMETYGDNPSVQAIYDNTNTLTNSFNFREVGSDEVENKLSQINPKKSTGYDHIPPKLVKLSSNVLASPLTSIINKGLITSTFPQDMKMAEVTPAYKKKDRLIKGNYRPISSFPCFSKIFLECL